MGLTKTPAQRLHTARPGALGDLLGDLLQLLAAVAEGQDTPRPQGPKDLKDPATPSPTTHSPGHACRRAKSRKPAQPESEANKNVRSLSRSEQI